METTESVKAIAAIFEALKVDTVEKVEDYEIPLPEWDGPDLVMP